MGKPLPFFHFSPTVQSELAAVEASVTNSVKAVKALSTVLKEACIKPQPLYGPFSGTTRVSRFKKRTSGLYGARKD